MPEAQSPEPPDPGSELHAPGSQPEFTEDTALAFFARQLDGLKWQYHRSTGHPVLFCGFNGGEALWDFNMVARSKGDGDFLLGVNSFIPNKARPDRRAAVAELLTRINWELNLGCFEMNYADGEIRFRTNVMIPAADITDGIVEHLMRSNISIVDERIHQIMAVLYSDVTPEAALKLSASDQQPGTSNQPPPDSQPRFDFN